MQAFDPLTGSCNFASWHSRTVDIQCCMIVVTACLYDIWLFFGEFSKFEKKRRFDYTLTWDHMAAMVQLRKFQNAVFPEVHTIESRSWYQMKAVCLDFAHVKYVMRACVGRGTRTNFVR